jgi:hypothetical protein
MTLPAFLLAAADSKFVWLGCKRFVVPAVNARWSLARVFALVAMQTALAVALGCVISLKIAGQPLGWLMWLLGVFVACQCIVVAGLMALCWNQRAARLRENPNLPVGLPSSHFRLGRWALGLLYLVVLGLVTPLAMLVTEENVRGQLAWKREHARLVAQGERLTFREIFGLEIPAADNAGTAPIFRPFFDYDPFAFAGGPISDSDSALSRQSSNAVARIKEALFVPYNYLPDKREGPAIYPKHPEDMANWSAAYRKLVASPHQGEPSWKTELKLPAPGNPARDVLAGLAPGDAVVAEMCAAATRPRAQFAVRWGEGFSPSLPLLTVLKNAQQNLKLRCVAHLAAGETDAAFTDATNALNVAELLREEPFQISLLVHIAQGAYVISTLWEGLVEHRWTDAQLGVYQERLGRMDYLQGLVRAFEGERANAIVYLDRFIARPPAAGQAGEGMGFEHVGRLIPFGMLRQNETALTRYYTALLTDLRGHFTTVPQSGFALLLPDPELEELKFKRMPYSPFSFMVKMLGPAQVNVRGKAVRLQTTVNLAITVCALERYRLAHGGYPENLDALVPTFMPKLLPDLMNGQPFHYRRTDDGWFLLYSVGEDGKDDGGVFRVKKGYPIKDWPWPVPTRAEAGSLF